MSRNNYRKSTLPQFANPQQMFETWLTDTSTLSLSAFGTRRLFDALKHAMWANSKKSLESEVYLKNRAPSTFDQRCPRCTRPHPGGADSCKSKNMVSENMDQLKSKRILFESSTIELLHLNFRFVKYAEKWAILSSFTK